MAIRFDREYGVEGQVEQPRRLGVPPFGAHRTERTPYGDLGRIKTRAGKDGRHILLVEDDQLIADMYRLRLEMDGWSIEIAHDGEDGVRRALADPPALILLDLLLPRLDGIEVLRRLRSERATRYTPVLVISNAAGLAGREAEARDLGIVDWIVKANTTPAGLAGRVARILGN